MAKQTVNNGDTFGVARGKINSNFTEVYNDLATKATGVSTTNSGTAQLRFRSETTAVITARAGLTLVVEKIV